MHTKIKKFIRYIPEENLKTFLLDYGLNLPKNFKWQNNHENYCLLLLNSICSANDNQKPLLLSIIERVHDMADDLGQAALKAVIGYNSDFLNLKSEYDRCLWALINHAEKFEQAEYYASLDQKRKSKPWSAYEGPVERKIRKSTKYIAEFKKLILQHLDIGKKIKVEFFEIIETNHRNKETKVFHLTTFYDGLQKSVSTFDKEKIVTKYISPVSEFNISYEPESGIIEVASDHRDNRPLLAKAFANAFLRTNHDVEEIKIKKYNLLKLIDHYDFMKDVDVNDLIEDVKVTLLKLKPLNGRNSTTIESSFIDQRSIYHLVQEWYTQNNPLHGSFLVKKAKLSIKFKAGNGYPRGKLFHITITDPNCCDLKNKTEKEKLIGNKYLEKWGLVEQV